MEEYKLLIEKYLLLNNEIKSLTDEKDSVKNKLKILLERDGMTDVNTDVGSVNINYRTTTSVNKEVGYELFGDRFKEALKETNFPVITVKKRK